MVYFLKLWQFATVVLGIHFFCSDLIRWKLWWSVQRRANDTAKNEVRKQLFIPIVKSSADVVKASWQRMMSYFVWGFVSEYTSIFRTSFVAENVLLFKAQVQEDTLAILPTRCGQNASILKIQAGCLTCQHDTHTTAFILTWALPDFQVASIKIQCEGNYFNTKALFNYTFFVFSLWCVGNKKQT